MKAGIPKTFKGIAPEVGALIGTKDKNFKEILKNLLEIVLQYAVKNYNKWVDLAPLIMKLYDAYL